MTELIDLTGNAFQRGAGQAAASPGATEAVRALIGDRLEAGRPLLARPGAAAFLMRLEAYLGENDPDGLAELDGIATGFGIPRGDLFAFLHLAVLGDTLHGEGCSAWAVSHPEFGALIGKNRDVRGDTHRLQRLFRHSDPAWGGRTVTCVGSLGAPAVYSSGINSDGLALVDTQIHTSDHGVGILRYFLMTRLLARAATVAEALDEIASLDHAGGGSLVLADRGGALAAVELGHSALPVERGGDWVARTNHFVSAELAPANLRVLSDAMAVSSVDRLTRLRRWLGAEARGLTIARAEAMMATHDGPEGAGLCRHGADGDAETISGAVFATAAPSLYFCPARPCVADWRRVDAR